MDDPNAIVVGISGCSSSGKTTLARLLRDIFPNTFILHEDDFYKPESQLPMKDGLLDWDCPAAISVPAMQTALAHIRATGTFPVGLDKSFHLSSRTNHGVASPSTSTPPPSQPPSLIISSPLPSSIPSEKSASDLKLDAELLTTFPTPQPELDSKEDRNTVGKCPASAEKIAFLKAKVDAWVHPGQPGYAIFFKDDKKKKLDMCLFDGFLLYCKEMEPVMSLIDIKIFLLVSRAKATQRREARDGYVTLEGFWKDPPGYVDKIVWPNYADAHAWLFEDGNVEGKLKSTVLNEMGIHAQVEKGLDINFEETLEWAVETVMTELERRYYNKS